MEFWWCLKRWGPEMSTFGVLGLTCETPAGEGEKRAKFWGVRRRGRSGRGGVERRAVQKKKKRKKEKRRNEERKKKKEKKKKKKRKNKKEKEEKIN